MRASEGRAFSAACTRTPPVQPTMRTKAMSNTIPHLAQVLMMPSSPSQVCTHPYALQPPCHCVVLVCSCSPSCYHPSCRCQAHKKDIARPRETSMPREKQSAALVPAHMGHEPRRLQLGRLLAGEQCAQLSDLVAQLGGFLELQRLGVRQHLFVELDDQSLHLGGRHLRQHLLAQLLDLVRLAPRQVDEFRDGFVDGLGCDAMLLVVLQLILTAPARLRHGTAHRAGAVS